MKYFFIAGERSGDLHASNLIKEIHKLDAEAEFRGIGGELAEKSGATLYLKYEELAVMGFAEVLIKLPVILRFLRQTADEIKKWKPDVVILIDYGGFNMRLASRLNGSGIPVYYYITPKIWAWNTSRAYALKKTVDRLFVILPFEKSFFKKYGLEADYVGNPILDSIASFKQQDNFIGQNHLPVGKPWLALLPGSRLQEINAMMDLVPELAKRFGGHDLIVAGVSNVSLNAYAQTKGIANVHLVIDQAYEVLSRSQMALVTSGTATLETALLKVPQVVVYKTSPLSYFIAKLLVKVKYISLVNLIADREVVKELIQNDYQIEKITQELDKLAEGKSERNQQLADYEQLSIQMGHAGASTVAAGLMLQYLKNKS